MGNAAIKDPPFRVFHLIRGKAVDKHETRENKRYFIKNKKLFAENRGSPIFVKNMNGLSKKMDSMARLDRYWNFCMWTSACLTLFREFMIIIMTII